MSRLAHASAQRILASEQRIVNILWYSRGKLLLYPKNSMEQKSLSPYFGSVLLEWSAPEHDTFELGKISQVIVTIALVLIIAWALYTNSPIMAITFILTGITGYLLHIAEPKIYHFAITSRGILAHNEFYTFDTLKSFCIHTDPPLNGLLSLHTHGRLISHVHIPLSDLDQSTVRLYLREHVQEEPHDPSVIDILEKLLHI